MACPDCGKEVSRRAVMCPHCGCPGAAIQEAAQAADEAARPKHLTDAVTEGRKGQAVAILQQDQRYVVMDSFLLAGAASLALTSLDTGDTIAYGEPELASEVPLLRFKVTGQAALSYLSLRPEKAPPGSASFLDAKDQACPADKAVVRLNGEGELVAIRVEGEMASISAGTTWLPVKPAELRTQLSLLTKARELSQGGKLPAETLAELKSVKWISPCLEGKAAAMIQSQEKETKKP